MPLLRDMQRPKRPLENCFPKVSRREVNLGRGNIDYHKKITNGNFLKGVGRTRIKCSEGSISLGRERRLFLSRMKKWKKRMDIAW